MDCNKAEAVRAKEIAEKRMQEGNFCEARNIALKAQQLFPGLEDISQLLTVCQVHLSAQNIVFGSENDWYGILQIDQQANEMTIKKQYRKLALLLHPDKNSFAGAEAAFKLIGEASRVLSDRAKRVLFDVKYRCSAKMPAQEPTSHGTNGKFSFTESQRAAMNFNIPTSQAKGFNIYQQAQQQSFWTACPLCHARYEYHRSYMNRALLCQSCSRPFTVHDLGREVVPPKSQQRPIPIQKEISDEERANSVLEKTRVSVNRMIFQTRLDPPMHKRGSADDGGNVQLKASEVKKAESILNDDAAIHMDSGTTINTISKREENLAPDTGENFNPKSNDNSKGNTVFQDNVSNFSQKSFIQSSSRIPTSTRSSRKEKLFSYKVKLNEDGYDSAGASKRSKPNENVAGEENLNTSDKQRAPIGDSANPATAIDRHPKEFKQEASTSTKESLDNHKCKSGEAKVTTFAAAMFNHNDKKPDVDDDSEPNLDFTAAPEVIEYAAPEFNDFDGNRREQCFTVDQIWAIYDTVDGMPRFYARVRKVYAQEFKLRITWLEPDPSNENEINWLNEDLPVACGKFKQGISEDTTDRLMFSHQMCLMRSRLRSSGSIYPRKGETWALFKNWDINWSSDPAKHFPFMFEFVEVLSDFHQNAGITVAYLAKVKGYTSLFYYTKQQGVLSFQIPPYDIYRFSHRIPSFKMTGAEREGVPVGSFEFDPASLPSDLSELTESDDVKETKHFGAEVHSSCSDRPERRVKSSTLSDKIGTPKKADAKSCHNVEALQLQSEGKKISGFAMAYNASSPLCLHQNMASGNCFDFSVNKSPEKFHPSQIWALYSEMDGLPKTYALIEKMEYKKASSATVLKLHVSLLEASTQPKGSIGSVSCVSCGVFKPNIDKVMVLSLASFSHRVNAVLKDKSSYEIFPRKDEVWAIYNNWSSVSAGPGLMKGDHDIVRVLDDNDRKIQVQVLQPVHGFKSLFRAAKFQRSKSVILDIPTTEIARFSHQIPAIWHSGDNDIRLRDSWELDASSIPRVVICVD